MFLDPCVILFTAVVSAFGWGCLNKGVSASRGSVSRGVCIHLRGLHPGGLGRHLLPIGYCLMHHKRMWMTRKHSSRMRTARLLAGGGVPRGCVSTRMCTHTHPTQRHPSWTQRHTPCRQTDACENNTLPQTSFAGGNNIVSESLKS